MAHCVVPHAVVSSGLCSYLVACHGEAIGRCFKSVDLLSLEPDAMWSCVGKKVEPWWLWHTSGWQGADAED